VFAFVSALGLSLIAAELLFRLIEVPSHSLARRWFPMPSRRRDSSNPSTAIDCRDPTLGSTVHRARSLSLATVLILLWTVELWGMQATSMSTNHVAGPRFDFWAPKIRLVLDGFFVTAICLLLPAPLLYIVAFLGMVTSIGLIAYEQFFNASLSILTLLNSWNEAPFLATHVWAWAPKWPAMLLLGTFIAKCWLVFQMNRCPISWKPRLTAGTVALCLYLALMYATTFVDPLSAISSKRGVARLGRIRGYLGPWIAELYFLNSPKLLAAAVERSRQQSDILTPVEAPITIRPRLVIVQAESLDYNTIGLTVNGREVTPFLNRLRARSLFYRVRAYHKLGSADADFTMLMGGPPAMNVLNYNIPGFPYDTALPHFLAKYGFETLSFHGNWGSFYRRKDAFKQMGFERIFFREELEAEFPVELDSLGIRDASVFEISSLLLRKTSDRVCHFIITLTSHDPFKFVKPDSSYPCPDNRDATERYLNHVHYLDKCLQTYIASLPADTTVVIYGDHPAGTAGLGFTPSLYNGVKYVPVFVYDNRTDLGASQVTHDEFQKPESTLRMIDFTAFLRNRIEATFATPTSDKKSR
jgi:phosphoglycerol transferase MdoB-like AlkP superfamily enzyme